MSEEVSEYFILHRHTGSESRWTTNYTPEYSLDSLKWVNRWIKDKRVEGNRGEYLVVKAIYINRPSISEDVGLEDY